MEYTITDEHIKELDHPGLTKLYDTVECRYTTWKSYQMGIPLPYKMSEKECLFLLKDIASALDYLHCIKLLFLDIKPDNIVMKIQNRVEFMFCDLESIIYDIDYKMSLDEINGFSEGYYLIRGGYTPGYIAPEYIEYIEDADGQVTTQYDIYALGITIAEILGIQIMPFTINDISLTKINNLYIRPYILAKISKLDISERFKALIMSMIDVDPLKRPRAYEIITNTLISDLTDDQRPMQPLTRLANTTAKCIVVKAIQDARKKLSSLV